LKSNVTSKNFYKGDPKKVAKNLLGKSLIRKLRDDTLEGIIVETEAYYGLEDPASRAYKGLKKYNKMMWSEPGRIFIYNVHNNWMLNIVAHDLGKIGAVLIRAIEPTRGIETMRMNRPVSKIRDLTNGPGKLTKALRINKKLHGKKVTSKQSEIFVTENNLNFKISSSNRIGVTKDLDKHLRFFIKDNYYLSR